MILWTQPLGHFVHGTGLHCVQKEPRSWRNVGWENVRGGASGSLRAASGGAPWGLTTRAGVNSSALAVARHQR